MSELRRFEHHRFVGLRDTMTVFDVSDDDQRAALEERLAADDLVDRKLVQTFGPDTAAEALNRGFRPAR